MPDEIMPVGTQATTEEPVEVNEADFSPEADAALMAQIQDQIKRGDVPEDGGQSPDEDPKREPDGKFKAKDKDGDAPAPKPQAKPPAKPTPAADSPGALAEARRLMESDDPADIDRACMLAFGKPARELRFQSRQWHEFRRKIEQAETKAAAKHQEAERALTEVKTTAFQLIPLARARDALARGDAVGFLKHINSDPDSFQRALITQMTGQVSSKDPELMARMDRLERQAQAKEEQAKKLAAENETLRQAETLRTTIKGISDTLAQSGDPRFERVANKAKFLERVHEIQCEHYRPPAPGQKEGSTIWDLEAAELAWDELYGGVVDGAATRQGRAKPVATDPRQGRAIPAERARPKPSTNVRHVQAAEAPPDDDDSEIDYTDDDARRAHEERLMRRINSYNESRM
jgi:hypothetical protein